MIVFIVPQALLRRINRVKPSEEVSRSKHLVDYQRQMAYHCPDLRGTDPDMRSRSVLSATSTGPCSTVVS